MIKNLPLQILQENYVKDYIRIERLGQFDKISH